MFGPNFNRADLLNNLQNLREQQIRNSIQQFKMQLKMLQSRLASELQFNRFLVRKANQPKVQNMMNFTPPEFNFCYKEQPATATLLNPVKKQEIQFCPENAQKIMPEQFITGSFKASGTQEVNQDLKPKIKVQAKTVLKHHQASQSQHEQNHEKNQTKNIPKNYGKAILSFIQKNIQKYLNVVKPILSKERLTVADLLNHIKKHKKEVNSIHYLKLMWGFQNFNDPIFKCIRVLSYTFMRKYCLSYIFNSRIKNYNTHIKYRRRMLQGIENPAEFTCIKQF